MLNKDLLKEYITKNGIYIKKDYQTEKTAFSTTEADMLFDIEDVSWWFQYRVNLIYEVATKYLNKDSIVWDIGGGNGFTANFFQKKGWKSALLEPSLPECINASQRGVKNIVCNVLNKQDFLNNTIKQALILDVLEHIDDSDKMLKTLYNAVHCGGAVVFTVPAYNILWSSEDDAAGHFRRYKRKELVAAVEKAGFKVEYSSYIFSFLWLPIFLLRTLAEKTGLLKRVDERNEEEKKKIQEKQFKKPNKIASTVLSWLENYEKNRVLAGKCLPFGSSVLLVARKPK